MVFRIRLDEDSCGYGRQLPGGVLVQFYDVRRPREAELDVSDLRHAGTAFRVWVADEAFGRRSTWEPVGVLPTTPDEEQEIHQTFKQDVTTGALTIYAGPVGGDEREERPARQDEVLDLERASVWHREHVEDRLRDHFAGRPCTWVMPPVDAAEAGTWRSSGGGSDGPSN